MPPNPTYNLIFTVHNCVNLPQLLSTTNAYCVCTFNGEKKRSKVADSSNSPIFNENFVFQNVRVIKYDAETGAVKGEDKVRRSEVWAC